MIARWAAYFLSLCLSACWGGAGLSGSTPAGPGELSVQVDNGWGEVWVDGERLTDESPLNAWVLPAGEHALRVLHPPSEGVFVDRVIDIRSDCMTILIVDAKDGRQTVEFAGDGPEDAQRCAR